MQLISAITYSVYLFLSGRKTIYLYCIRMTLNLAFLVKCYCCFLCNFGVTRCPDSVRFRFLSSLHYLGVRLFVRLLLTWGCCCRFNAFLGAFSQGDSSPLLSIFSFMYGPFLAVFCVVLRF